MRDEHFLRPRLENPSDGDSRTVYVYRQPAKYTVGVDLAKSVISGRGPNLALIKKLFGTENALCGYWYKPKSVFYYNGLPPSPRRAIRQTLYWLDSYREGIMKGTAWRGWGHEESRETVRCSILDCARA